MWLSYSIVKLYTHVAYVEYAHLKPKNPPIHENDAKGPLIIEPSGIASYSSVVLLMYASRSTTVWTVHCYHVSAPRCTDFPLTVKTLYYWRSFMMQDEGKYVISRRNISIVLHRKHRRLLSSLTVKRAESSNLCLSSDVTSAT
jgi:hypothetical protein